MLSFFPKITNLKLLSGYEMELTFDTGETFRFKPVLRGVICEPLKDENEFRKVRIISHKGGIEWPNGYCLGADNIYEICIKS